MFPFDAQEWLDFHKQQPEVGFTANGAAPGPEAAPGSQQMPNNRAFKTSIELADYLTNNGQGRGSSDGDVDRLLRIIFHEGFDREELRSAYANSKQFRRYQDTPRIDSEVS